MATPPGRWIGARGGLEAVLAVAGAGVVVLLVWTATRPVPITAVRILSGDASLLSGAPLAPWRPWDDPRLLPLLDPPRRLLVVQDFAEEREASGDAELGERGSFPVFEEPGPGALVRLEVGSADVEPGREADETRILVFLDGEAEPRIDLAVPDLVSGGVAPFLPPLVVAGSGVGGTSHVPIPYAAGCRIVLTGPLAPRLDVRTLFYRLRDSGGVRTFDGGEDLAPLVRWLRDPDADPWPEPNPSVTVRRRGELPAGGELELYRGDGPGLVTGLRLESGAHEALLAEARLVLAVDGDVVVNAPLADAFGVVSRGARTLLWPTWVGRGPDRRTLRWYLPVAFERSLEIRLLGAREDDFRVASWVRRSALLPLHRSGRIDVDSGPIRTLNPRRLVTVDVEGAGGTWVDGLVEGRVPSDGSRSIRMDADGIVGWDGVGPLAGAERALGPLPVPFARQLEVRFAQEHGVESPRTVSWSYREPPWRRSLPMKVADTPRLRRDDAPSLEGPGSSSGEEPVDQGREDSIRTLAVGRLPVEATPGSGEGVVFRFDVAVCASRPRLRRLLDSEVGAPMLLVRREGVPVGLLPAVKAGPSHDVVDLAVEFPVPDDVLELTFDPGPARGYELWCDLEDRPFFREGFESGDLRGWNGGGCERGIAECRDPTSR